MPFLTVGLEIYGLKNTSFLIRDIKSVSREPRINDPRIFIPMLFRLN